MSIEYDFYRNPNSQGTNKKRYHARVVAKGSVSTDELAKEIQLESSLTVADVKAVLIALGDKLASHLSEGKRVQLDGIGYFLVNLKCKEEVCTTHAIRSENVEFKSVSFRADHELKKHLKQQRIRRSKNPVHSVSMTDEEADRILTMFFEKHEILTRKQFQMQCGLVKSTAHRILQKLVAEGKLKNVATKHSPVYMPDNGHYAGEVAEK